MSNTKPLVIGLTGTMTSGKGAVQYFLVDRGFTYIRHTEPIFSKGEEKGLDMSDRKNWIKIAVEMRKEKGKEVFAKMAADRIKQDDRYVIAPLRYSEDIKYLKDKFDAIILYIDAPLETRYKRTFLSEKGIGMTKDEFMKRNDFECNPTGDDKELLPNVSKCKDLADEIVINDGSLNELNEKLEKIFRKYKIANVEDKGYQEGFDV